MNTLSRFARSRQGRQLAQRAMDYARSPEGKRRIARVREQLAQRRRPSRR